MYFLEVPLNEQSTNEDSINFKENLNIVLQYIETFKSVKQSDFCLAEIK